MDGTSSSLTGEVIGSQSPKSARKTTIFGLVEIRIEQTFQNRYNAASSALFNETNFIPFVINISKLIESVQNEPSVNIFFYNVVK